MPTRIEHEARAHAMRLPVAIEMEVEVVQIKVRVDVDVEDSDPFTQKGVSRRQEIPALARTKVKATKFWM